MKNDITYIIIAITFIAVLVIYKRTVSWYFYAKNNGVDCPFSDIIYINLRSINPRLIIPAYVIAKKKGFDISLTKIQVNMLAGCNPDKIVESMILAKKKNIDLSFDLASVIDLQGTDLLDCVENAHSKQDLLAIVEEVD